MKKTARVTPRNIQFKEDVQIKEIPRNSTDMSDSRRASWNPKLTEETFAQTSTKARNCIIAITISGAALVIVIIGTILGIVLSQKTTTTPDQSLTYNQVCQTGSNQCLSSQGLSCSNGFCSCASPYSWNQITKTCTLLTYNRACVTSNQCNSSLGLSCTNQICQCDSYHSWNSMNNTCVIILNNTLTYGNTCANDSSQCNSSIDLTCAGTCTCNNLKIWNISSCVCPAGTFLNSSNLCQTAYKYNGSCLVGSNQCDSTRSLSCIANISLCQCDSTRYWNRNFETCLSRLNYTLACSDNSDCIPTLICPSVPGYCNCPLSLPDYVCNCLNTTYFDSTLSQCVPRATFNGACISSMNYTCLPTLYCRAGTCACPLGTNWIVANSSCA